MRGDAALALCILLAAKFRIGGGKHRMRDHLGVAPWVTVKRPSASADSIGIPAKQIIRHTESCGGEAIGSVEAKRTLQPRQCLGGPTSPCQNGSPVCQVVRIARVDFECAVDLLKRGVVSLFEKIYKGEHTIGPRRCRIQCERLLSQFLRMFEIVCKELGPA